MKSGGEAPKIVQIETRYVETDATNFRDVVQSLTGKNSSTAWIGQSNNSKNADASSSSMAKSGGNSSHAKGGTAITTTTKPQQDQEGFAATKEGVVPNSMLTNNMSFKDFDRLLLEMPPPTVGIEELPWF